MMSQRSPLTTQQSEYARNMATDFDAEILENAVYENVGEDRELAQLCDAATSTKGAREQRETAHGSSAALVSDIEEAWGKLSYIARERAREVVAEACVTVLEDGEAWVSEGHCEKESMDAAQKEAREWLRTNTNVANRLDSDIIDETVRRQEDTDEQ